METQQLISEINALPESVRLAIEQLVLLLRQQVAAQKLPPILRSSSPLTDEEKAEQQVETGGWASRDDITSGAEYIRQVRRGLRQP